MSSRSTEHRITTPANPSLSTTNESPIPSVHRMEKEEAEEASTNPSRIGFQHVPACVAGSLLGASLYLLIEKFGTRRQQLGTTIPKTPRKRIFWVSACVGGAIGTLLSMKYAQTEHQSVSCPYYAHRDNLERAVRRESDLRTLERNRTRKSIHSPSVVSEDELNKLSLERVQRERNRLFRRASLLEVLQGDRGGLSDSHGGRWVK